jgi:hypothetical protein
VAIEIEGAALTPDVIPNVLGSILEQLNSWIDTAMSKSYDGISGMPAQMDTPQPTVLNQQQPAAGCEL